MLRGEVSLMRVLPHRHGRFLAIKRKQEKKAEDERRLLAEFKASKKHKQETCQRSTTKKSATKKPKVESKKPKKESAVKVLSRITPA